MQLFKYIFPAICICFSAAAIGSGRVIYNSIVSSEQKIALGVNPEGHLNTPNGNIARNARATGLAYKFPGSTGWRDATSPGCLCEGWGAGANGIYGRADVSVGGVYRIFKESFTGSTANITSVVSIGKDTSNKLIQVTHDFGPSPEAQHILFQGLVTVTNISNGPLKDVRYRRVMDWDIPPTEFREYVTHGGVRAARGASDPPKLIEACDDGFEYPNPWGGCSPLSSRTKNTDFDSDGPRDHGSSFTFQLPDLACGESISFMIYYGVADTREKALEAVSDVGASLYSFGNSQSSRTGVTFIFAFKGVSGVKLANELPPKAASLPSLSKKQTFGDVTPYNNALYQAVFEYRKDRQWKGDVNRYSLNSDGSISTGGAQSAGTLLASTNSSKRNLWTAAPSLTHSLNNFTTTNLLRLKPELYRDPVTTISDDDARDLIEFIRGQDRYDEDGDGNYTEERDWKLADTYHAQPVIMPPPTSMPVSESVKGEFYYGKSKPSPHSAFVKDNKSRETLVFAPANNGVLHAFNASTMREKWGFIPPPVLDSLKGMYNSKGAGGIKGKTNSIYLLDGTPTVKDIYYGGKWRTVLFGGLGYGGKGYYLIDVTNPSAPTHLASFIHNNANRTISHWDVSGNRTTYDYKVSTVPASLDYSGLGEAWARPLITLLPYQGRLQWVAILGGGYGGPDGVKAGFGSTVYIISLEPNSSSGSRIGTVIREISISPTSASDVANGIISPVSAITADTASKADYYGSIVYLADLQGRIWKLDLAKNSLDESESEMFTTEIHLNAEATLANDRLLFHKPTNSFVDGTPFYFFGSGDMTRVQRRDGTILNRIFGISDKDFPKHQSVSSDSSLPYTISSLSNGALRRCPGASDKGWYQNLSDLLSGVTTGAKVTGSATVTNGDDNVYFTAYVPNSVEGCSIDGSSNLIFVSQDCGTQEVSAIDVGKGIATSPVIYKGNVYIGIGNRKEGDSTGAGGVDTIFRKSITDTSVDDGSGYKIENWRQIY